MGNSVVVFPWCSSVRFPTSGCVRSIMRYKTRSSGSTPIFEAMESRLLLSGTVYVVDSLQDTTTVDGMVTLREAIAAANANLPVGDAEAGSGAGVDTVTFDQVALEAEALAADYNWTIDDGLRIVLEGEQLEISDDLTILGLGQDMLTIDADGRSRVFHIAGSFMETAISHLTITGGSLSGDGGGIYQQSGTLTLSNIIVSDNEARYGGGIYGYHSTITLYSSTVSDNSASSDGGGIYGYNSSMSLTSSIVSGNTASYRAGGVLNSGGLGKLTLTYTDVLENTAFDNGGGICGAATLTYSSVSDNTSNRRGGGFYVYSSNELKLTNSIVSGNTSLYDGGAIHSEGVVTLTNSTMSGNSSSFSSSDGGGMYNNDGSALLVNSVVSGNTSARNGGGIYSSRGGLTLRNTTVAGNTAAYLGGGIYCYNDGAVLVNTIVALNRGGDTYGQASGLYSIINADPEFIDAAGGDYRLSASSIAVDQGLTALAVDAEGAPLTIDRAFNPRVLGAAVDIGAYECLSLPQTRETPSTIVTTVSDVTDYGDGEITLREAIYYSSIGGVSEPITFDSSLSGGRILLEGSPLLLHKTVEIDASSIGGITLDAQGASRVLVVGQAYHGVDLVDLTITGGATSGPGGGIYSYEGVLRLTNTSVSGNTAHAIWGGGGIFNEGTLKLTNARVSGNAAPFGGGIMNRGFLTAMDSTVTDNSAGRGGGIYNTHDLILTNTTVSNNTATVGGGLLRYSGVTFVLTNATVSGNTASESGGGIGCDAGPPTLNNTVVALNIAPVDPDVEGGYTGRNHFVGSVDGDPRMTAITDDNGIARYYVPDPGSPLIDAGDNALAVDPDGGLLATDQRGEGRIHNGIVDIGAIEYAPIAISSRHVFYNNSNFDGGDPFAGPADDNAIDVGKAALLPGQTVSEHNFSSYSKGINGLMIDIDGLDAVPVSESFGVRVYDEEFGYWSPGPVPSVSVRAGAGVGGADRVTLIWPDGAIVNTWVEITAKSDANGGGIGLPDDDAFYFGSSVGDSDGDGRVGDSDYDLFVGGFGTGGAVGVTPGDFDGDGRVDLADFAIMRSRFGESVGTPAFPGPAPIAASAPVLSVETELDAPATLSVLAKQGGAAASPAIAPVVGLSPVTADAFAPPVNDESSESTPERELVGVLSGHSVATGVSLGTDDLLASVLAEAVGLEFQS